VTLRGAMLATIEWLTTAAVIVGAIVGAIVAFLLALLWRQGWREGSPVEMRDGETVIGTPPPKRRSGEFPE
jgi:glycerol uptake facilitator-like aquaporin